MTEEFTYKTKDEVLEINKEIIARNGYEIKTVKLDDVHIACPAYLGFFPKLYIDGYVENKIIYIYDCVDCTKTLGQQIQELFTLCNTEDGSIYDDEDVDFDWLQGREINVILTKNDNGFTECLAIGSIDDDNWINLRTWVDDILNK